MSAALPREQAHWLPQENFALEKGPIGALLRRNADEFGDRRATLWLDGGEIRQITFAQLAVEAERIARGLVERLSPGARVAVWSVNTIDYAVLFYACATAGMVIVPLNQAWTDEETRHALDLAAPELLVTGRDGRGNSLRSRAERIAACEMIDLADAARLTSSDPAVTLPDVPEDHPYLIQFTSGTTGRAKGALLSHRAAIAGASLTMQVARSGSPQTWLVYTPFHHIGGSCSILLSALASGGAYVVLGKFDTNQLVSLIEPVGATQLSGVPTMWFDLLRHPDFPSCEKVEGVMLGGAAVSPALVEEIESRTKAPVFVTFGQSECPAITRTLPSDDMETKTRTIGRPVAHAEVKIVDPATGATCAFGQVGEICVRGPMTMDEYWRDPTATAEAIDKDGFLHTGDLGSMASTGICSIRGRHRDLIIRGGENIHPAEIEDILQQHPGVALAAAVGQPHPRLGQEVAAFIVAREWAGDLPNALKEHAARHLSHYKVPAHWHFVDKLPMTASGKVRKVDLAPIAAKPPEQPG